MLGPSGSGKTTCLRLIAGFETPTAGRVLLHGEDVTARPPFERDVNTVFQDYALFPHMSVDDNVAYGLMVKKVAKAERTQPRRRGPALVRLGGYGDRAPGPALGRAAPARRAGPRAREPAAGAAARRAARRARPEAAAGDADRAEGDPAGGRHHLPVRHPRPGRGAHDERPRRGVQPRPHRAGRHARRRSTSSPTPRSSPGSSGRPTVLPDRRAALPGHRHAGAPPGEDPPASRPRPPSTARTTPRPASCATSSTSARHAGPRRARRRGDLVVLAANDSGPPPEAARGTRVRAVWPRVRRAGRSPIRPSTTDDHDSTDDITNAEEAP